MIHSLSSNKEEFRPITFDRGINLIIAERAPGATERHSRNARGKTSLVQAINYCLGGSKPSAFRPLGSDGWEFSLVMDVFGSEIRATRSIQGGSRVSVDAPHGAIPTILADYVREDGTVSVADWKFLLGLGLFELDEEFTEIKNGLSPRTLLSYVVRLDAPRDPTKIIAQQPAWSSRQHVAFLVGLDWRYTHELVRMEKEEETFEALKYAADQRLVPEIMGNESDLLLRRSEAERQLAHLNERLQEFVVLEDPDGTIRRSNEVASDLTDLANEQVVDRRLLSLYRESLSDTEHPAEDDAISQLFDELQLAFTNSALLRFQQVAEFHNAIVSNRNRFLDSEISRIQARIVEREITINTLNDQRSVLLRQLSSGGGIADLLELQKNASEAEARLASIDASINAVRSIQASRDALSVRQATTRRDARADLERDRRHLDDINVRFDSMMRRLYDRSGSINVEIDDLGYKFSVRVSGSSSSGITRMQLLCFDLTLMAQSRQNRHPHFLIHDSVVFDGVDPRQVAAALVLANDVADEVDGQYIATFNSNDVPDQIKSTGWYEKSIQRTILDTEKGGAFGVEF